MDKEKDLKNDPEEQEKQTDPQEDEKDGNVFGGAFDKVFGNAEGGGSASEDEDEAETQGNP